MSFKTQTEETFSSIVLRFREPIKVFLERLKTPRLRAERLDRKTFKVTFDKKLFVRFVRLLKRNGLEHLIAKIYYKGLIFYGLGDFLEYYFHSRLEEWIEERGYPFRYQKIFDSSGRCVGFEILFDFPPGFNAVDIKDFEVATADLDLLIVSGALRAVSRLVLDKREDFTDDKLVLLNLFPTTLTDPIFGLLFLKLRDESSLNNLVVEVLEYRIFDKSSFTRVLSSLRDNGVKVAIDDWGSENAGITRIILTNPDFLKIDKSITWSRLGRKLVKPFIRTLQRELRIKVIVEGVDCEIHKKWAQSVGAYMQGYYLHKPQPLMDLGEFQTPGDNGDG